ncbi:Autophagy-related protein 11 [Cordyceps fumosorosea ARSEF 2679]|uniref:Autophagy-related protein 11 n=1 Tax=Cordyceps fumosorosea (strain ARSEF 2679) TaxID=1081104 RepID=A0A167ZIZ1_CORFA|nr:Autophagy-related protein 11 [Cordyceps fumosorosea ARSEF 2679]OAA67574.1 Autophagy-related protein 11 [Cordyceps fumosorosea ARSEF 2679]
MATQVLIAHTGQRLEVDTSRFSTLDDLKAWIARNSSVSLQHMVALTPQGRSVKFASIHVEKELYIYDIRVTQQTAAGSSPVVGVDTQLPRPYAIPDAPNSISDAEDIESWRELYKARRSWAIRLAEDCGRLDTAARARYDEIDVMIKCLDAALANLEFSVKQIEPKHAELKKWVDPILLEHDRLASSWEHYLSLARNTPISPTMVQFMTNRASVKNEPTLEDLIEPETAKKAGKLAPTARRRFSDKAAELEKAVKHMHQGLKKLIADFEALMSRSVLTHNNDTAQLLEDIEVVVKQMDDDYRSALAYGSSQRDLAQASKVASNHTERLVPSLKKRAKEMDEMLYYAASARNSIAAESVNFMKAITEITALHSGVRNQINVLNSSEDDMTTFDYLRLIYQLPYMYASFVVETIRRREWTEKVKQDSSTLANEMALFQDEEAKRRRRWQKMVGSTYGPGLDTNVMGLEVNLQGDEEAWPQLTKDDLDDFIQHLKAQHTDETLLEDIIKLVQELASPTKQQSKRLKAFKNGSIHEAALGRSGLLIRGDDDLLRSLQDDKSRLESKLKTAESRVRRLEDLLHRQSQASRHGNLFQPPVMQPQERPGSSASIRSNRIDDRRRSSDGADPLLRRIAQLENDLREEKHRSTILQKDVDVKSTQHNEIKSQMEEANSTKKDLMENMEAFKREFMDERKSLEDELKVLKARLEETEDDMEHFGESRENEKAAYDEKMQALEDEVQRLKNEHNDESLKAQGQVEYLRKEAQLQREKLDASNRLVQTTKDEHHGVTRKLREAEETAEKQIELLQKLHQDMVPGSDAPGDAIDLTEAVANYAADLLSKLRDAESEASVLKTNLDQASNGTKELRTELAETRLTLAQEEMGAMHLRENLAEEKAKVTALEGELNEGREQLSALRGQLSDGETGSETLQKKLEATERKVSELTEDLASRQSRVGSLEEEVHMFQTKMTSLQEKLSSSVTHHEARDERTKELTQKVYSQNDRLIRLLERIGYSVARDGAEMTVTKIPRAERQGQSAHDLSDPSSSVKRSTSLSKPMNNSVDLELLHWINNSDAAAEEERYTSFMQSLGSFNMELFADTIYHRIKEAEHKARKWQRDAKTYRDRAHVHQRDASDKIAFRHFKDGDLALFLPTRNQQAGAWAAFNVGFPHYFLREQDAHRLRHREWLVARITRIQERVVDLSKSLTRSNNALKEGNAVNEDENDNPFQLSDGLRWYLIDAQEDKPGAPSTPGMGKSTVAANNVEATANIQSQAVGAKGKNRDSISSIEGINKTLSKSLESRRSSSNSKKVPFSIAGGAAFLKSSALASETDSLRAAAPETPAGTSPIQPSPLGAMVSKSQQEGEGAADGGEGPLGASNAAESRSSVQREESTESAGKKSMVWDALWSVDYSYESPTK